ncbi:isocitrate/isopropylmalate dehydrogenase family protein [Xylophilus rhododendri]|uniref:Isocitrate/isopropylmalate dehydrogenase family protein n=1 Tax=Xylophilus rhododendri TaxID=2697032 RepID=A0A857J5G3_9BURK|nr:isocitrate/isopropylmalate family dehydrogenase [Xylophilus rhododendri]QHI98463.1 isocitrate/isopropylmalate dehydrogenase family protein [Xylophilus rhododendri]
MKIVVLPGDGIGPETMAVAVDVLETVSARFGLGITLDHDVAGHASMEQYGATVRPELLDKVKAADALMLGPASAYEYPNQINASKHFRKGLDLYANIRPARTYAGMDHRFGEFDLVVVRENTEGFYADRNMESGGSEILVTRDVAISMRRITRVCCERIARSAFELAMTRRKHVTIVHKASVLKICDGMFVDVCREVAKDYPEVVVDDVIVDAMMALVVRHPQRYDVIVTTNMFGDILSDLTSELSGSIGLGGSLNAGADAAMGQAAHGSAPDIAGQDIANPFSQVLSAAQLLGWYGQKQNDARFLQASKAIDEAVAAGIAAGEATRDVSGRLGTKATGAALVKRLQQA